MQALGAALLVPASLALVVEAFPGERRAHAIGLWGATAAVAAGLGPPLGGALVELGGWRWAFLVNIPFGAVAVWAAARQLVESRAPGRRRMPDLRGAALLVGCLAMLNLGIVKGNDWGWTSPQVLAALGASAVLLALFVVSSGRHPSPLLDPALLRIPTFRVATVATVVAGLGFYAYLLTNILWLQYVWGYDVLRAGLALVPGALVAAVVAARLGPLADRHGYRVFVVPGALVWAAAYVWYHQRVGLSPAFWAEWFPGQVLSGIGVGATLPLLGSAALAAVPGGRYATASAVVSSARQLGGVLGIAALVVILGDPTPATAVAAFHDGWVLSIAAFVVVAVLAVPLGRIRRHVDDVDGDERGAALVLLPAPVTTQDATDAGHEVDLADLPLLAGLPASARDALAAATREVDVPAGTWLFHAGDPTGSAYLVRSGRLEVVVGDEVVRELGAGAVIGELALMTGETRSAGARARRDARLLEVPRDAFAGLLESDPTASRTMLTQVAHQLRTAGGRAPVRATATPRVVAVVAVHSGSRTGDVAAAVLVRLRTHLHVGAPGRVDAAGLARAERDHDRVLLVADGDDVEWRDFCLRQADLVVLVGRADVPPTGAGGPTPATAPDLVLVGPAPSAEARAAWVTATDARRLTLVEGSLAVGLRALADRIGGRSLGVVLAGGGARAFAHIGVLRELEEAGLHVDRLAGSSIGAIVAGVYAVSRDGAELEEACYAEFVRRRPFSDWTVPTRALARGARTRAGLGRVLGTDTVLEGLPRRLQVVTTDLSRRSRQVHSRGNLVDAVIASARLPVLFAPIATDDGRLLVDGGVLDNLPVDLLTDRDEGPVIAVNISMGGGSTGTARVGRPRVPPLGETLLRTMMIGSGGAVDAARERGALVLTPATLGVGLLEFHQQDRMVRAGREAARAVLDGPGGEWLSGRLGAQDDIPEDGPLIALPEPRGQPVPLS